MKTTREQQPAGRRARKLANVKQALLKALLARLEERGLDEISARELAEAVDISEATLFNHFGSKVDLLVYYVQLWSLEAAWHAAAAAGNGAKAAIAAVFEVTGKRVAESPSAMAEIIAFQARLREPPARCEPSAAEKLQAFPDLPGVEQLTTQGVDGILVPLIARAIADGELPAETDQRGALLAFCSVFFGVPLLVGRMAPDLVRDAYRQQLDLVWRGLTVQAGKER